jgi:uncharacterized membrane protein
MDFMFSFLATALIVVVLLYFAWILWDMDNTMNHPEFKNPEKGMDKPL